jgi:osmotically-inducible protein OsmY
VVTLTGEVDSQSKRQEAGKVAASVPNVQQVVNELQVKKVEGAFVRLIRRLKGKNLYKC